MDSIEGACFAINLLITPQRFALINILIVAGINELKSSFFLLCYLAVLVHTKPTFHLIVGGNQWILITGQLCGLVDIFHKPPLFW